MGTLLAAVVIASLGIALVAGWLAWRASRAERARSAARVAALVAAAGGSRSTDGLVWPPEPADEPTSVAAIPPVAVERQPPAPGRRTRVRRPAVALAVVVALVAGAAAAWSLSASPTSVSASVVSAAPIELLSLHERRDGNRLFVEGLVRNPTASPAVRGLEAAILLFDGHGDYLTSARVPIETPRLAPGGESRFALSLVTPATAVRYRVGFRTGEHIVSHIDRRTRVETDDGVHR